MMILIAGLVVIGAAMVGALFLMTARGGDENDMGIPITERKQPVRVVLKPPIAKVVGTVDEGSGSTTMMERPKTDR